MVQPVELITNATKQMVLPAHDGLTLRLVSLVVRALFSNLIVLAPKHLWHFCFANPR